MGGRGGGGGGELVGGGGGRGGWVSWFCYIFVFFLLNLWS